MFDGGLTLTANIEVSVLLNEDSDMTEKELVEDVQTWLEHGVAVAEWRMSHNPSIRAIQTKLTFGDKE